METIFANCDTVGLVREQSKCYDAETSGLYGHWIVDPSATIADKTKPTVAELLAAELAGLAIGIRNVDIGTSGSYAPTNAPINGATEFGGRPAGQIGNDWTAVTIDRQGVGNEANINQWNGRTDVYHYFITATRITPVVDESTNLTVAKVNPTGVTDINHVSYTLTFRKFDTNLLLTYPFASKVGSTDLNKYPELAFGSVVENVTGPATITGKTVTTVEDSPVDLGVVITGATSYELVSGTLPAGLTGLDQGTQYKVSGTPTTVGTTKVKVRGINAAGIAGTYEITFVITAA